MGVSTNTEHSHKGWKILDTTKGGIGPIDYPLVSDKDHSISKAYDVLLDCGLATRGMFVIDKNVVVKAEHRNCDPLGRSLDEVLRLVDALKFHEESAAAGKVQVCPANWKLGKKGMTPNLEGVAEFNASGGVKQFLNLDV